MIILSIRSHRTMSFPAYRATLLYFVYLPHKSVRNVCNDLVEVLARVRVNLLKFAVNFAVMRANLRAEF